MKDFIASAVAREREARREFRAPEMEIAFGDLFRCILCNRLRRDEQRREPNSEVCMKCVEAAGFDLNSE